MDMFDILDRDEKKVEVISHFDLETQRSADEVGWKNIDLMYMSVGVVFREPENKFYVFQEDKVHEMIAMLFDSDRVVSYNGLGFDNLVLSHYTNEDFKKMNCTDMMLDIKDALKRDRGPSLDNVAQATLGVGKTGSGLDALKWWKEGEMDKIIKYCTGDVVVTRDTFNHGKQRGHIFCTNRTGKRIMLPINWTIRNQGVFNV